MDNFRKPMDILVTYEERRWKELLQLEIRHTQQIEAKGRYTVHTDPEYHYGADTFRLRNESTFAAVQAVPEAHPFCQGCPGHLQCMLDESAVCCVTAYCSKEWEGNARVGWLSLWSEWSDGMTYQSDGYRSVETDGIYRIPEMALALFKVMKFRREHLRTKVGLTDRIGT